ncbi:hypothetical protein BVIET440_30005 [Burkholderia vietnamiensis]
MEFARGVAQCVCAIETEAPENFWSGTTLENDWPQ